MLGLYLDGWVLACFVWSGFDLLFCALMMIVLFRIWILWYLHFKWWLFRTYDGYGFLLNLWVVVLVTLLCVCVWCLVIYLVRFCWSR